MHTPTPGQQPGPYRRTAAWRRRTLAGAAAGPAGQGFREHLRLGRKGLAIGMDIGGTKVAAGVVDAEGRILARGQAVHSRAATPGPWSRSSSSWLRSWAQGHRIWSVGIGAAGWMDLDGGTVLFSPHLAWRNEPLRDNLQRLLRRPVLLTNDADAAGLGGMALWCRAGPEPPGLHHPRHRHRRCHGDGRPGGARTLWRGRGVRPPDHHARRPPLRVRQPRLLGAVRVRQRAWPGSPGTRRRQLPGGPGTAQGRGRPRGAHHRSDRHRAGHGRRRRPPGSCWRTSGSGWDWASPTSPPRWIRASS